MTAFAHTPVMPNEVISGLDIKADGVYFDGTLGGGGHSELILSKLTSGKLIAVDKDADALMFAAERLSPFHDKVIFAHDDFKNAEKILAGFQVKALDGVLLDLGVSSYQLDNAERGFSYMKDAPLDMRMDASQYLTAFNVVNEYPLAELSRVISDYGEDKLARRIAERIVKARDKKTIATTAELAEIVTAAYPAATRFKYGNPAKRTFQAIRIEVNEELSGLYDAVLSLARSLKVGGRMAVISFHSLEDRIIKNAFKYLESPCVCPPNMPVCTCGKTAQAKVLTKKPITPTKEEMKANSRAES
ncbi:MAG TPA: 16S rRNA (cytosine(1402)-N(4))-methyltransferase RsmH, partial [Clostridia bacterium]|nr:16S rRNA (cytosine(1402)-N(4))-methyltransferase RsmH [Clostridia bacterium]